MNTEPLVPSLHVDDLVLIGRGTFGADFPPIPISIKPFGVLVATGVYLGGYLAVRQARRLGLDERALFSFCLWVIGMGFIGGHVLDAIFYYPEQLLEDPLRLVRLWDGLSSFGGFVGAGAGALIWGWRRRVPILPYADVVASAFPVGWVFGRAGCALAHDHPGLRSEAWIAVRYPTGGRFDLGLYEMLCMIPIALSFLVLRRKPRPWGFYLGILAISYAPWRFALDFLRARDVAVVDPRYGGLTPAQWACFVLLGLGVWRLWATLARAGSLAAVAPPRA
jgi:phosphatidylglycerol---prolipoprotein diacylglyceryl transferase